MDEDAWDAPAETTDLVERRDEVVERVKAHVGTIARELALLQGGDYGQRSFSTDAGEWTVKYEAGAIQYLRYKGKSGRETYVISAKRPPEPGDLAAAMADYDAFVDAFNRHVRSLDGTLDDVSLDFPAVASTAELVAERDRIVERVREVTDAMAGELHRFEGTDYGLFAQRVDGMRWELKWEGDRTSYLRVGGEAGVYLVSQYGPPSAPDVRRLAGEFSHFVDAYNEYVEELDSDLSTVSL